MSIASAGILLYRLTEAGDLEVFIAHMGGPYWSTKTEGAWTIPKGEFDPDEESSLHAATREFTEELGVPVPSADFAELGVFPYASGKRVIVFVADGSDFDPDSFAFGEFEMEWPPRSGMRARFPEVDRAEWCDADTARDRLVRGQRPAVDALVTALVDLD